MAGPAAPTLAEAAALHARLRPSPLTQRENRDCLLQFCRFAQLRQEGSCSELTALTVLSFQGEMAGLAPSTRQHRLRLLRGFLLRLEAAGWARAGLAAQVLVPRAVHRLPAAGLPLSQQRALLAAAGDPRARALVSLLLFTGARCGELLGADVGQFDGRVLAVCGKSGTRSLALPPACRWALDAYLGTRRGLGPHSPLLASRQGRLSRRRALEILRACCEQAGLPRVTPHVLRHAAAARWLSAGVPLVLVAQQLGHRHPSTTLDHYASLLPVDVARGLGSDPLLQEAGDGGEAAAAGSAVGGIEMRYLMHHHGSLGACGRR
ncbi:MAG TPA: site-specific integrase [Candidatus Dormibacteraeota bacterium]|nr:site-specific integrase [Candidatus Dormibacteraeota bacterium]